MTGLLRFEDVSVTYRTGDGDVPGRTVIGAALFLAAVVLVSLAVAGGTFRRRDLA